MHVAAGPGWFGLIIISDYDVLSNKKKVLLVRARSGQVMPGLLLCVQLGRIWDHDSHEGTHWQHLASALSLVCQCLRLPVGVRYRATGPGMNLKSLGAGASAAST